MKEPKTKARSKFRPAEFAALLTLLGLVAHREIMDCNAVLDFDIWWHLRVGRWISENLSVPHTGLFSRTAADRPWVAYSWGFEVLVSQVERWFGLVGLTIFCAVLVLLVVFALYWLLRRVSGDFWTAWALTAVGTWAIYHNTAPRPVLFSIAFFCIVLGLILETNLTSSARPLYWLPPIFLLWANLHIQFIYGLFLLTLFVLVVALQQLAQSRGISHPFFRYREAAIPLKSLLGILAASFVATLIGPYSFRLYQVIAEYAGSTASYEWISELQALSFRNSAHYAQLLITVAAFLALGRSRKGVDPFKLALLTIATVVAYRTTRDSWFICIPALAVIAEELAPEKPESESHLQTGLGLVAAVAVVLLLAWSYEISDQTLKAKMKGKFPVDSVEFIRAAKLPGPIYNTLNFGGYLIWSLPDHPVSIDGRNDLYGDTVDARYWNTLRGRPEWVADPDINNANTLLVDRAYPLVDFVASDPRFQRVFMDARSVVFVRRR